jgi:hypothetical protein
VDKQRKVILSEDLNKKGVYPKNKESGDKFTSQLILQRESNELELLNLD